MALVCKELATGASLDQVLSVCPGRWPIKACAEGLAYKGPGYSVMSAESGMNFSQEVSPFFFGDTPLKDSGGTFLIRFSLMDLVGLRLPDYAAGLILVFGKFLPN